MKRKIAAILALGAFLIGPTPSLVLAHDEPGMSEKGEKMAEHRLEHLTKALKLTTDQQGQVKQILQDEATQMKPLHEQMKTIHEQSDGKISALLTGDQKKKYDELKAKREEKMKK